MASYIVTSEGRRLKKVAMRTTTPVDDSAAKAVSVEAPRVCYNMPDEEFFPLMMRLRDKASRLMGERLAELARWNAADRDKVLLWFGQDSEVTRQTLSGGLTRMREIMRGLTEKNFIKFTPEGVRAVGCEPRPDSLAAAMVCKPDRTYTLFLNTTFCNLEAEANRYDGIPFAQDSKLVVLVHEVAHFPNSMDAEDLWYTLRQSQDRAAARDKFCVANADNIAAYVVNVPNWRGDSPAWRS